MDHAGRKSTMNQTDEGPTQSYDVSEVFDAEVLPLMQQIVAICDREKIPVVASFMIRFNAANDQGVFSTTYQPKPGRTPAAFRDCLQHLLTEGEFAAWQAGRLDR